jgi:hypothetical protein
MNHKKEASDPMNDKKGDPKHITKQAAGTFFLQKTQM